MCSATERMGLAGCLALAFVLASCSPHSESVAEPDAATAHSCPVGDMGQAAEIELVHRSADGEAVVTHSMAPLPLVMADQGGFSLLVAVRAKNMDACQLTITASLTDECDGQLLAVRSQPVLLEEAADGWAVPQNPASFANWANLSACPQLSATRSLAGEPYHLTVVAEDGSGRRAEASTRIVPTCSTVSDASRTFCMCQCSLDYVLGDECIIVAEDSEIESSGCMSVSDTPSHPPADFVR